MFSDIICELEEHICITVYCNLCYTLKICLLTLTLAPLTYWVPSGFGEYFSRSANLFFHINDKNRFLRCLLLFILHMCRTFLYEAALYDIYAFVKFVPHFFLVLYLFLFLFSFFFSLQSFLVCKTCKYLKCWKKS